MAVVVFDGSGSSDADGNPLTFTWKLNETTIYQGLNTSFPCDLPLGTHTISLVVNDGQVDSAPDIVTITVFDKTPPVPDNQILPTISGECSAEIAAIPTATDSCAGKINGTTTDPTKYASEGTYTVTWTYDDGHGNTTTQAQTVIVSDITAPTISATSLGCVPWGKGKGSQANKIVVTASDNCAPSSAVSLSIVKVEIFNNGGNLVNGNGILEIAGNTVYVKPSGNGWSAVITATVSDGKNTVTISTNKIPLQKC